MGIRFPEPKERVDRFREAVAVVDSLLRNDTSSYEGTHYRIEEAHLRPGPVQKPRPPLVLAAHRTNMLRICAEYADVWNSFGTVEEMKRRNEILDEHCESVGRDPAAIRRSFYGWASKMAEQGLPDPWESAGAFEEVVGRYSEVGIDEFLIDQPRPDQQKTLEKVAGDLIPGFSPA